MTKKLKNYNFHRAKNIQAMLTELVSSMCLIMDLNLNIIFKTAQYVHIFFFNIKICDFTMYYFFLIFYRTLYYPEHEKLTLNNYQVDKAI